MITKLKAQDGRKMLAIGLMVGMLAAAPLGIRAYANDDETTPPDQTETTDDQTEEDTPESEEPVIEDPVEEVPVDETPVDQTEEPEEVPVENDEEEAPAEDDPTVADLQSAIAIAALEHSGVEVISAKIKLLDGTKVYKVVFADGWIAYVSADTGDVMLLKDQDGNKRSCHNYAKKYWLKKHPHWAPWTADWQAWSAAWVHQQQWAAAQWNWQWQTEQSDSETDPANNVQSAETDEAQAGFNTSQKHKRYSNFNTGHNAKQSNKSNKQVQYQYSPSYYGGSGNYHNPWLLKP